MFNGFIKRPKLVWIAVITVIAVTLATFFLARRLHPEYTLGY